jgi:hypothetical protein
MDWPTFIYATVLNLAVAIMYLIGLHQGYRRATPAENRTSRKLLKEASRGWFDK